MKERYETSHDWNRGIPPVKHERSVPKWLRDSPFLVVQCDLRLRGVSSPHRMAEPLYELYSLFHTQAYCYRMPQTYSLFVVFTSFSWRAMPCCPIIPRLKSWTLLIMKTFLKFLAEITGFEPMMAESNSAVITSSLYLNIINQSNYLFATLSILRTLCLDTQWVDLHCLTFYTSTPQ